MLGEITHLQGIIDDLVVLTAEPHKLPPASEQVRPAPGTARLGWGQWRRQWEGVWGSSWAQKATPMGSRGTCPHKQGVPGTRRGLTLSRRPHVPAGSAGPGSKQASPDGASGLRAHTCQLPHTRAAAPWPPCPPLSTRLPPHQGQSSLTAPWRSSRSALAVCPAPRRALPVGHLVQSPPRPLRQEGSAAFPKGKLRLREDKRLAWGQSRARVGPHGLARPLWADSSTSQPQGVLGSTRFPRVLAGPASLRSREGTISPASPRSLAALPFVPE